MSIPAPEQTGKAGNGWLPWAVLGLSVTLSFGIGMLAGREAAGANPGDTLWVEQLPPGAVQTPTKPDSTPPKVPQPAAAAEAIPVQPPQEGFVASKTGSKYYLPSCTGAKRIKDENKVWFTTKQEAEAAGYTPATSCKGL